MERIIRLLGERNHYLTKFCELNETELQKFTEGNFDQIDDFYNTREGILEIINQIETMIDKQIHVLDDVVTIAPSYKKMAQKLLKERDTLVTQILGQDIEILSCIDAAKNDIIKELQGLQKGKKALSGYKSGHRDQILDEEL